MARKIQEWLFSQGKFAIDTKGSRHQKAGDSAIFSDSGRFCNQESRFHKAGNHINRVQPCPGTIFSTARPLLVFFFCCFASDVAFFWVTFYFRVDSRLQFFERFLTDNCRMNILVQTTQLLTYIFAFLSAKKVSCIVFLLLRFLYPRRILFY